MRLNGGIVIPPGWGFAPLKRLTRFGYGEAISADERDPIGTVRVYGSNGPFDQHSAANTLGPCIIVGRKGSYGKCQYSDEPVFAVDTTFVVDHRHNKADLRYLFHLLGILGLDELSDDTAVPGLSREKAYQSLTPLPPLETQKRIAAFLDAKTAQIDGLIARKQALLERLAEKRQAVITQAVTKGLNPAAPMKDSGIDWLGQIPAHWEVKRLDHLNHDRRPICYGIVLPGPHFQGGVPIIKGGDVRPERLKRELLNCTDPEIDAANPRARVATGDLVYTIRGSFGDVELVSEELAGCNLTQDAARISPVAEVDRRWLLMALKSSAVRGSLAARSIGATIKGINIFDLRRALLPTPPPREQREIADNLTSATTYLDGIRHRVETSISHLADYRAALITSAVTGQIEGLR